MSERPIVILGSGFAGSVLARLLASRGRSVTLVERGTHPRFALGESSTPLAAICLERLAREYDLPDLASLAAYGRWSRDLPHLRKGLKRGFTFYGHTRGRPFSNDDRNSNRLLVAASPDDEIADAHWLRSDVDAHLARRAVEEGAQLLDRCEIVSVEGEAGRWALTGHRDGRPVRLEAAYLVDATGAAGFLARRFGAAREPSTLDLRTGLVFGHFTGVDSFVEAAGARGAAFPDSPYPEERAAVHHLIEEGWVYVLPFDDGVVSAGAVIDRSHPDAGTLLADDPVRSWRRILEAYPALRDQFGEARAVHGPAIVPHIQRTATRFEAPGWALLPHSAFFLSPMFSTGIAWSLLATERLAAALTASDASEAASRSRAYGALLQEEATSLTKLLAPAYRLRGNFEAFAAWSQVYFAAASHAEASQRLVDLPRGTRWRDVGFLGATDPAIRHALDAGASSLLADSPPVDPLSAIAALIERRNVAGLADPRRRGSFPVDLHALVEAHDRLGLSREQVVAGLPRLRGG